MQDAKDVQVLKKWLDDTGDALSTQFKIAVHGADPGGTSFYRYCIDRHNEALILYWNGELSRCALKVIELHDRVTAHRGGKSLF
jgi:hypothetical protein